MAPFTLLALVITLTALLSYVNVRFIGLPTTIGVMLIALVLSLALVGLGPLFPGLAAQADALLNRLDFKELLFHGVLSFLLFAGALNVDVERLLEQKGAVLALATLGLLLSMVLVGTGAWLVLGWAGAPLPYAYALVFGALISPTDPVAVLSILRSTGVPERLEVTIAGESLFNDGVGVVLFLVMLEVAAGSGSVTAGSVALLFLREAGGGLLVGAVLGYAAYGMLRHVDDYSVEVLLTLAVATGGYALAGALGVSGPLAMVVAGLFVGSLGRARAMSETTRHHLDLFWEMIDQILNALLFALMGLELLVISFSARLLLAGLLLIPVVLAARALSVGLPMVLLRPRYHFDRGLLRIMTWGGLRGGIAVALALSLPAGPARGVILAVTYAVVVFSILVQGPTTGRLVRRVLPQQA